MAMEMAPRVHARVASLDFMTISLL